MGMKKIILICAFVALTQNSQAQLGVPSFNNSSAAILIFLPMSGCRHYHPELESQFSISYEKFVLRTGLNWPLKLEPVNKNAVEELFNEKLDIDTCNNFIENLDNGYFDEDIIKFYKRK